MTSQSFLFVSNILSFEEGKGYLKVKCLIAELDKTSLNGNRYKFTESQQICESIRGKPVRFGTTWVGRHLKDAPIIGVVHRAWTEGKRLLAWIRIHSKEFIDGIRSGVQYKFSFGGQAESRKVVATEEGYYQELSGVKPNHLQMLSPDSLAGFPSTKILEVEESVMYAAKDWRSLLPALIAGDII